MRIYPDRKDIRILDIGAGTGFAGKEVIRFAPSQWETALLCNGVSHWLGANLESALHCNRPLAQTPQCTNPTSHIAPLCKRNMYAHSCNKVVHCGIWDWCVIFLWGIVGFVRWICNDDIGTCTRFQHYWPFVMGILSSPAWIRNYIRNHKAWEAIINPITKLLRFGNGWIISSQAASPCLILEVCCPPLILMKAFCMLTHWGRDKMTAIFHADDSFKCIF